MEPVRIVIETGAGRRRQEIVLEVPPEVDLIAAAKELRRLGEGKAPAMGRCGECVGVYYPPRDYTIQDVDPFTGEASAPRPRGTIHDFCIFFHPSRVAIADAYFDGDSVRIYLNGRLVAAPAHVQAGLFDAPGEGDRTAVEGAPVVELVSTYERDPSLRKACLQAHGCACCVCGMDFGRTYGALAAGFIHVHHLTPLASAGGEHRVDPVQDLAPICPNCHAVIHMRDPPFTPAEVRSMLQSQRPSP